MSDAESAALLGVASRALEGQARADGGRPDGGRLGLLVGAGRVSGTSRRPSASMAAARCPPGRYTDIG